MTCRECVPPGTAWYRVAWCGCEPDQFCPSNRACRNRVHDPDDCPVSDSEVWRVNDRLLYLGDELAGMMICPVLAARIVAAMNGDRG